jgi:hypothetical protein
MSNNLVTHSGFLEIVDVIFEHMKYNLLKLLLLSLIFTSCASYNYDYTTSNDGSIKIKADNQKRFEVVTKYDSKIIADGSGLIFTQLPNLTKKNLTLLLICENYDTVELKIKRAPRTDVLIKDMCLGGLPLFIDLFKSDFYRISKKSKSLNVHFELSQSYMASELDKIRFSKEIVKFQQWIDKYPKSVLLDSVIYIRDSLELNETLKTESEFALQEFIKTHSQSKVLNQSIMILNEVVEAKEEFKAVKIENSAEAYEEYLKNYPLSFQSREAHTNLLRLALDKAVKSESLVGLLNYLNDYLIPYSTFLYEADLNIRLFAFSNALDNQLLAENIGTNNEMSYEKYSNLWKSYNNVIEVVPAQYLKKLEKTVSSQTSIYNLLFEKLKFNKNSNEQYSFIKRVRVDFPNYFLDTSAKGMVLDIMNSAEIKSGTIRAWDIGYIAELVKNKKSSNSNTLFRRNQYLYKGVQYFALSDDVNYEEISFLDGSLHGGSKCFKDTIIDFSVMYELGVVREINYFKQGELVKKTTFVTKGNGEILPFGYEEKSEYSYEYENGINLTLKKLDEIEKEGYALAKSGDIDGAIEILSLALKNNFPPSTKQLVNLKRALTSVEIMKKQHLEKLEALRLAEEAKQRAVELAEENRRKKLQIAQQKQQELANLQEQKRQRQSEIARLGEEYRKNPMRVVGEIEINKLMGNYSGPTHDEILLWKRKWEIQNPSETFFIPEEKSNQRVIEKIVPTANFTTEEEVIRYLRGKSFFNSDYNVTIRYGSIAMYNTEGLKTTNGKGGQSYFINLRIAPYGTTAIIRAMDLNGGGNDAEFKLYNDGRILLGNNTFYLKQ